MHRDNEAFGAATATSQTVHNIVLGNATGAIGTKVD